jgi:hypothetical protein
MALRFPTVKGCVLGSSESSGVETRPMSESSEVESRVATGKWTIAARVPLRRNRVESAQVSVVGSRTVVNLFG